jgi:cell division protein FtsZ
MVFITAGMGGGTGTGAAPVIARMARERGILTVGVVTKPFTFEGKRRAMAAESGISELIPHVDTLIVIPNQNLFHLANERTGWKEAFKMADNVLYMGVRGVTDLMVVPGMINLDFADIRTVMAEMGKAMMGTGEADGEQRAMRAAEAAINNPLLENTSMAGARGLLINITGGDDMTLFEVDEAANRIRREVDDEANIIFGTAIDESLNGRVRVSVVATGIDTPAARSESKPMLQVVNGGMVAAEPEEAPMATVSPATTTATGGAPRPTMATAMPAVAPARPQMPPPLPSGGLRGGNGAAPIGLRQPSEPAPTATAQPLRDVEPISDDMPPPPRRIPDHLRQPVGQPARPARAQSPLFHPAETAAPATGAPKRTLFSMVTGAIRGGLPHAAPAPQPVESPRAEVRSETPAETVRHTGGDGKIDVPNFLLRQSS